MGRGSGRKRDDLRRMGDIREIEELREILGLPKLSTKTEECQKCGNDFKCSYIGSRRINLFCDRIHREGWN